MSSRRVAAALFFLVASSAAWAQDGHLSPLSPAELRRFSANRYTQPEPSWGLVLPSESVPEDYTLAAETEVLELYVEPLGLAIYLRDKRSGYLWSSGIPNASDERLNATWRAFAASALTIEYIGARERLNEESISRGPADVVLGLAPSGFDARVTFPESGISIGMEVRLEHDSLLVRIPDDGIVEGEFRLANVFVYPMLGASKLAERPGYLFVPDGPGALIRFDRNPGLFQASYRAQVYGRDEAIDPSEDYGALINSPRRVHLPVYGMAHSPGFAAFVAMIEEGDEHARIEATPGGVTTDFHWAAARFQKRKQYFQPTSRAGGGVRVFQEEREDFDIAVRFSFLAGDSADYVGMAAAYRDRLVDRGLLADRLPTPRGAGSAAPIPMMLDVIGADTRPANIGRELVVMTTFEETADMARDLAGAGVEDLRIGLIGYVQGGAGWTAPRREPAERALGGTGGLQQLAADLQALGVRLGAIVGYQTGYQGAGNFNAAQDTAGLYNGNLNVQTWRDGRVHVLSPAYALARTAEESRLLASQGFSAAQVLDLGGYLYSDPSRDLAREDAAAANAAALARLSAGGLEVGVFAANEYALSAADYLLEAPQYSSHYLYASDTVPFYQIVTSGYLDTFGYHRNFTSDPTDELLRHIDFGTFPRFIATTTETRELDGTETAFFFSTHYPQWRDRMIYEYEAIRSALSAVRGQSIVGRGVLAPGVVRVLYESGSAILVNYTTLPYRYGAREIPAQGLLVVTEEVP